MTTINSDPIALDRMPAVLDATGRRHAQRVYDDVREGVMTRPIHVGRTSCWPRHEVRAIVLARIAGQDDGQIKKLVDQLHIRRASAIPGAAK